MGITLAGAGNSDSTTVVRGEWGIKINEFLQRLEPFGYSGAALVAKDGEVILRKGYGLADRETGRMVTPETVFTVASITKQFTGAAIVKLEMEGKLSVNDPINKYFDNVPLDKSDITIHHLLTHTAGLIDGLGDDHDLEATRDNTLRNALQSELLWKPGTKHRYSNLSYSLLGMIVEKVSGKGYEKYLQEHLFAPAGMKRTGYLAPQYEPDDLAIGYQSGTRWGTVMERPMLEDGPCWNLRANGGIHSTVNDMYRWHQALLGDKILSAEAKEKYFAPHADEGWGDSFYGYGWVNSKTRRGTKLLAHNGGNGVFSADFRRYVDENIVVYHSTNTSDFFVDPISESIAGILFGDKVDWPPKTIPLDATTMAPLAGDYELSDGALLTVSIDQGGLSITPQGQEAYSLVTPAGHRSARTLQKLNHKTVEMSLKSYKGDYGPLHKAFGHGPSLDEIARLEHKAWSEREEKYGRLKTVRALGTGGYHGPLLATIVRMEFEKGEALVQYVWHGASLAGISPLDQAPTFLFKPLSPLTFVSYKMQQKRHPTITFAKDDQGKINTLTITSQGRKMIAARVQ